MADSAAQVREVVACLRRWGHNVQEVPGWETRGSGSMTTTARIEHHTAGGPSGDAPSLRVVTFGRAGLRNSLSRWFVSRSGVIYLVALRASWHAGRGVKGSNSTLSGTESENTGLGEPWTPASLAAQAAISAAECIVFGVAPTGVWDHREHAPSRKPDRAGIDSPRWRTRVAETMRTGGSPPTEEDDVMKRGDSGAEVSVLQWRINQYLHGESDPRGRGQGYGLVVDGQYGPATEDYVRHVQSTFGYQTSGVYNLPTALRLQERLIQVGIIRPQVPNGASHTERGAD